MKIAYLLFVSKNPKLTAQLISRLSSEDSHFFIHVDSKRNIDDFVSLLQRKNVSFTKTRTPVYWAEFSGVEAILLLIREALAASERYDYFVLLSGSDYPICSKDYIHRFFQAHCGSEFLSLIKMPNDAAGKPVTRINTFRFRSDQPVLRFFGRALGKLGLAQRDHRSYLNNLDPYAGNTWWALTREACQYILAFERDNQAVVQFFQKTFAPEEMFFHTIIGNSHFRLRTRRNLLFEDWSAGGSRPEMIGARHIAQFEVQEKVMMDDVYGRGEVLFARKLGDQDMSCVQRIDEMICRKGQYFEQCAPTSTRDLDSPV